MNKLTECDDQGNSAVDCGRVSLRRKKGEEINRGRF